MTEAAKKREQARIDDAQGTDTHCPWHRVPYSRKDIGGGLTIKQCESCRLNLPMDKYTPGAGRVR